MFSDVHGKFRTVNTSLFLEHLQENGFVLILDPIKHDKGGENHILWHTEKGIFCGVQTWDKQRDFNACDMMFEVDTSDSKSVYIEVNALLRTGCIRTISAFPHGRYGVCAKWDAGCTNSPSTFADWLRRFSDHTFCPMWKCDDHVMAVPLGLCHLDYALYTKRTTNILAQLPEDVKAAIKPVMKN